jgi:hypothetical protein
MLKNEELTAAVERAREALTGKLSIAATPADVANLATVVLIRNGLDRIAAAIEERP